MTPLLRHLARRIEAEGPLSVADYMAEALGHPAHGYYMSRAPFGKEGDFITAPEISQMFGELLGLWCVEAWRAMGAPGRILLVELGPGRGTLMADALRAAKLAPDFLAAAEVHLVETSARLREVQAQALKDYSPVWHDRLTALPEGPVLILANELFDALPIRQIERCPDGWRERRVTLSSDGQSLAWTLAPSSPATEALIPEQLREAPLDSVFEFCPVGLNLAEEIGRRMTGGGAALIIDYGSAAPSLKPTLQAVKDHQFHDVLAAPGEADITAHVIFDPLAEAARAAGAQVLGLTPQGDFLKALGVELRAQQLLVGASKAQSAQIESAVARLTGADQMGDLFKVLGLSGPKSLPLAGF